MNDEHDSKSSYDFFVKKDYEKEYSLSPYSFKHIYIFFGVILILSNSIPLIYDFKNFINNISVKNIHNIIEMFFSRVPMILGLLVIFIAGFVKIKISSHLVYFLSLIIVVLICAIHFIVIEDPLTSNIKVFIFLCFMLFYPIIVLMTIFNWKILKITLWIIIIAILLLFFIGDGFNASLYYLLFIYDKLIVFIVLIIMSSWIFLITTMYLHERLRLPYLLDINVFSYLLMLFSFSLYITIFVLETCDFLNWITFIKYVFVYNIYICIYYLFAFSMIEFFTKSHVARLKSYTKPGISSLSNQDTQINKHVKFQGTRKLQKVQKPTQPIEPTVHKKPMKSAESTKSTALTKPTVPKKPMKSAEPTKHDESDKLKNHRKKNG